jgi:THO complex subunit 3
MAPAVPSQYRYISKDRLSSILTSTKPILYHDPTLRSGPHNIRSIGWTPTGHLIATGSMDRTIRIWNPDRPSHRHTTELRASGAVEKVSWNPGKESELLSLGADGLARFWDVRDKKSIAEVKVGGEAFTCAWAGDGRSVVVGRKVGGFAVWILFLLFPLLGFLGGGVIFYIDISWTS